VVPEALFTEATALPSAVGMIAVVPAPRLEPRVDAQFSVLLEDVQDPGNVGSILRTAAAAGVEQVLLSKHCAFAWAPKVLRAGQGAHFHLAIAEDVDLVAWSRAFRASGGELVALVPAGGASLFATDLRPPLALAIGNEGAGLSRALLDVAARAVTIPMPGGTESLNAATAAAVCLFEAVRQRGTAGPFGGAPAT
jgi:RNA methyltransferase, TrmH family